MTPTPDNNILPETEEAKISQAQVRSEIQEYLTVQRQRRRLFPRAALVGALAGCVAVAFRAVLAGGDTLRNILVIWTHHYPLFGWILPMLFGAAGTALAVLLVRHLAPEAAGSGIPHLEAVLHRFRELQWKRVLPVKFFGGALAIGGGLALGREGPTVQMGGTVGAAVSDWLQASTRERLTLIAAGAGAGLAAAFNAPLAGLVFVLEEVQKDFRPIVFGTAFIAAATSDIVTRFAAGQLPVFSIPSYPVPALSALPVFALLGLVAGLLGVVYNRSLIGTLNLFARLHARRVVPAAALVGASAGLIAWFAPGLVGGGHSLAESILEGHAALTAIPVLFLVRFVLSMASYGSGAPGGIFAPLLVLGALIGLGVGQLTHRLFPGLVPLPEIFAVVGMAAYFTAIVRAPLTGIVLITEMTGNYSQMLPLVVACFCAYTVAESLEELPIYENLLERDLLRGGLLPDLKEPIVVELEVEPGAPFEGREVRELGLPPGCILVSCREGDREWIPTATTRLEAHVRVTAVISPEAQRAIGVLRHGCEAPD
ncbi:MAG TPA: H(+)/Cl(-) exchange transporter ClcA [Chthonomonadaceae bacterium]|nr:H(+)/Cl(-) exchange transporter ClcA [Chthonomonadaceae bacterium]